VLKGGKNMGCNCKMVEMVLAIVIIVFALWETGASQWIILIAAILLLLHSWMCKSCKMPASSTAKKKKR
jgi:glucose dehydrogenase